MTRRYVLGLTWALAFCATGAVAAPAARAASCRLAGQWLNDGASRRIELASSGDRWFATLI
jgi:hypothetical protein